jgi:hypothetical protein
LISFKSSRFKSLLILLVKDYFPVIGFTNAGPHYDGLWGGLASTSQSKTGRVSLTLFHLHNRASVVRCGPLLLLGPEVKSRGVPGLRLQILASPTSPPLSLLDSIGTTLRRSRSVNPR